MNPDDNASPADGEVAPTDPRLRRLADLTAGNEAAIQRLARGNMQVDPSLFIMIRMSVLARLVLAPTELLDLDLECQAITHQQLANIEGQAARATLLAPAAPRVPTDVLTRGR